MKTTIALIALALTPLASEIANAQTETGKTPTSHFGIGLNGSNDHTIYSARKGDNIAGIHLQYRGERFNLTQETLTYRFLNRNKFHIEALAKSEARGFEAKNDALLSGMGDRDESLDLGLRAGYQTPYGLISLDATKDISTTHDGHEADLRIGPDFYSESPLKIGNSRFGLGLVAGVKWQSDDVVDYYYGVKDNEATADRAMYKGSAAVTPYIGLDGKVNITKKITLTGSAIYMDRPNEITDSPLVDKDHDLSLNAGFTYWFK